MAFNSWEETFERSDWSDKEKKLFIRFAEDARKNQIGERRIEKYRSVCATLRTISGLPLDKIVKDMDILGNVVAKINSSMKYEAETKQHLKLILGSLYNFVHEGDRSMTYAPKELKKLVRHRIKASDKRLAREIITREEVRELSKAANNTMDKALIWLLFESGARIGELEQMKKPDIRQIEEGLLVRVPAGKTGEREILVVEAASYVNKWLDEHPSKDKNAPLWASSQSDRPLSSAAISKRIRILVERLNERRKKQGIPQFSKSVNPHNFRHSRASELGAEPGMTEQILCKYFGWEIGSDMPRTYLHLTSEQVQRAILRTYGKAKPEEEKKIIIDWNCPRCKTKTPIGQNYCGTCGSPKDGKVISKTAMLEAEIKAMRAQIKEIQKAQLSAKMGRKPKS